MSDQITIINNLASCHLFPIEKFSCNGIRINTAWLLVNPLTRNNIRQRIKWQETFVYFKIWGNIEMLYLLWSHPATPAVPSIYCESNQFPGVNVTANNTILGLYHKPWQNQIKDIDSIHVERSWTRCRCFAGVTTGVEASLSLKTPCEVLEVSGGYKREVTVNTTEAETVVDELVWGVDSQIKVSH